MCILQFAFLVSSSADCGEPVHNISCVNLYVVDSCVCWRAHVCMRVCTCVFIRLFLFACVYFFSRSALSSQSSWSSPYSLISLLSSLVVMILTDFAFLSSSLDPNPLAKSLNLGSCVGLLGRFALLKLLMLLLMQLSDIIGICRLVMATPALLKPIIFPLLVAALVVVPVLRGLVRGVAWRDCDEAMSVATSNPKTAILVPTDNLLRLLCIIGRAPMPLTSACVLSRACVSFVRACRVLLRLYVPEAQMLFEGQGVGADWLAHAPPEAKSPNFLGQIQANSPYFGQFCLRRLRGYP